MSIAHLCTHAVTIERQTRANVDGEVAPTWANAATGVACLVQEEVGRVLQRESGQVVEYNAVGYFPTGTDIRPRNALDVSDRIVMTAPSAMNGFRFLVLNVVDEAGREDHLVAYLKRLPSGS